MTKASAEIELLLCCARVELDAEGAARLRHLAQAAPDWEQLLRSALRHGTMPLLYHHLKRTCPDLVPRGFMERLHDHFYRNAMRNQALNEELCRVLQLFADHAIPAIPYKGPALALNVYGDLSLRQFNDLDLMIQPRDVERASALVCEHGYERQWQLTPAQEAAYRRSDCEHLFTGGAGRVFLDLHWAFVRSYFPLKIDYRRFWQRLRPIALGCESETRSFAPEDLLVILCVHAGKDLWERLVWVADVAALLKAHSNLDWTQIVGAASAIGARRMLWLGLVLARDLLAAPLPEDIMRQVEAESIIRTLASKVRARLCQPEGAQINSLAEFLFHLKLHERLGEKCSFSFRFATTTNPADWAFVHLPDPLFFLYYLLRPVRLLIKHR
jgi:hypothetical protein